MFSFNFIEQTLKDGRNSLIILVVKKYLKIYNNTMFSGQKRDIFG